MIHIIDDWIIDADRYGYTLGRQSEYENKKTGTIETRIADASYHATVYQALQAFVRRAQRERVQICHVRGPNR